MIKGFMHSATNWGCWRCGGTFHGEVKYCLEVNRNDGVQIIVSAPLCDQCVEHDSGVDEFLVLRQVVNHNQPVYWKLRLRIFWRLLWGVRS